MHYLSYHDVLTLLLLVDQWFPKLIIKGNSSFFLYEHKEIISPVKLNKVHAPLKYSEHVISNILNYVFSEVQTWYCILYILFPSLSFWTNQTFCPKIRNFKGLQHYYKMSNNFIILYPSWCPRDIKGMSTNFLLLSYLCFAIASESC